MRTGRNAPGIRGRHPINKEEDMLLKMKTAFDKSKGYHYPALVRANSWHGNTEEKDYPIHLPMPIPGESWWERVRVVAIKLS